LFGVFEKIVAQIRTVNCNEGCKLYLKVANDINEDDKLIVLEVRKNIAAHKNAASAIDPKPYEAVMVLISRAILYGDRKLSPSPGFAQIL